MYKLPFETKVVKRIMGLLIKDLLRGMDLISCSDVHTIYSITCKTSADLLNVGNQMQIHILYVHAQTYAICEI